ncbi:MAG: hypothetical protein E7658_09375 [Ruminococcaceae bacterium]|nr:hypothetical protein [Oscillospiraceae bacterium]
MNISFLPTACFAPEIPPHGSILLRDTLTCCCYVSEYDITPYLREGENLLEFRPGDGWYRQKERIAEGNMAFGKNWAQGMHI